MPDSPARRVRVAPSILAADFSRLGEEVAAVTAAGADLIHIDVMDGHFVPNITFGPAVVAALRPHTDIPFHAHLMISPVEQFIEPFAEAGADIITVHPEATPHIHRLLQHVRAVGKRAGVALNPGTPVTILDETLDLADVILIMTVNPGFGGQTFINSQIDKIGAVRRRLDASSAPGRIDLEVDGGIDAKTAPRVVAAGADILAAGTAIFTGGKETYRRNIEALRCG